MALGELPQVISPGNFPPVISSDLESLLERMKRLEEQQKPPEMETFVAEENSLATVAESIVRETDAKTALSAAEETTVAVERRNDSAEVSLQHRKAAMAFMTSTRRGEGSGGRM